MAGWLCIHVALNTVDAPIINDDVILKSNRATVNQSHRTIDREVTNPSRMLSEYLMTWFEDLSVSGGMLCDFRVTVSIPQNVVSPK